MRSRVARTLRFAAATLLGLGLTLGLLGGGLDVATRIGLAAAEPAPPPRRPPVLDPAVPLSADEETALWAYLYRIAPIWDSDRPTVIRLLDQFLARYPNNQEAREKLYAVLIDHATALLREGDEDGARRHFLRAIQIAPQDRSEAAERLEALDATP